MSKIEAAIAQYDAEHDFARQFTLPQEDWANHTTAKWDGAYRWFRSPNVVCLEKYRQLKALKRI